MTDPVTRSDPETEPIQLSQNIPNITASLLPPRRPKIIDYGNTSTPKKTIVEKLTEVVISNPVNPIDEKPEAANDTIDPKSPEMPTFLANFSVEYEGGMKSEIEPEINYDPINKLKIKFMSRMGNRVK